MRLCFLLLFSCMIPQCLHYEILNSSNLKGYGEPVAHVAEVLAMVLCSSCMFDQVSHEIMMAVQFLDPFGHLPAGNLKYSNYDDFFYVPNVERSSKISMRSLFIYQQDIDPISIGLYPGRHKLFGAIWVILGMY